MKISVIITTYNRKDYLKKAIDSVRMQTFQDWEMIIIDDCSVDFTFEFVKKEYQMDSRICIYRNDKNKGPGVNRKNAMKKAQGEYVIFLDDDDAFIDKTYFENALLLFEKYADLSMVSASHIVYDVLNDSRNEKKFSYKERVDHKEFFLHFGLFDYVKPIISVTIIKREALMKAHYEDMEILNDTTIFLRALLYGPMGFINRPSAEYLVHGENISFHCDTDFIIQNLEEKYKVYRLAPSYFDFTEEQLSQWLLEQADITIIYFIKGSHPNFFQFRKILKWVKKRLNNKEKYLEYKKIYKESKSHRKEI